MAASKVNKISGSEEVAKFLDHLEHPLKSEIEEVRKIILSVNKAITEHIKWNAPSFCFNYEDRVTFNLQGKDFFRLIFHRGAKVKDSPEKGQLFEDTTGLLEWVTGDSAIIKISRMSDIESKREAISEVVAKWIEVTR